MDSFFDQDDLLHYNALSLVNEEIQKKPDLRIIYTDEDKIDEDGNHFDPYLNQTGISLINKSKLFLSSFSNFKEAS